MKLAIASGMLITALLIAGMIVPAMGQTKSTVEVYYFGTASCPYCTQTKPILEKLQEKNKNVSFYFYEPWSSEGQKKMKELDIDSGAPVPVVAVYANGTKVLFSEGVVVNATSLQSTLTKYATPKTATTKTNTTLCTSCIVDYGDNSSINADLRYPLMGIVAIASPVLGALGILCCAIIYTRR